MPSAQAADRAIAFGPERSRVERRTARPAPAAGRPAPGRRTGDSPAHTRSIERDLVVEALVAAIERRLEGPVVLVAPADPDAEA